MEKMKRITVIIVLAMLCLTTMASDDSSALNERFYQAKLKELTSRLHITSSQMKKFEPMYRSYSQEMKALWADRKRPIAPSTSTDAAAMAKRKMEMQQRAQGIRMKYIDKFATVLNAGQIDRFFEVESIIQEKLKERREQSRRR